MSDLTLLGAAALLERRTLNQLRQANELTARYGLVLSEEAQAMLCRRREQALQETERVELGEPMLGRLIYHFCDSPYLHQEIYADTIAQLLDLFFYYKSEALEMLSDDELLTYMEKEFNGRAQGSLTYLATTSLENLTRNIRYGHSINEEDLHDYDPDQF